MKKILFALVPLALFASCETMQVPTKFTNFSISEAEVSKKSFDIELTSDKSTISKVYKLTNQEDSSVSYAISDPVNGSKTNIDVDAEDLRYFTIISAENAQEIVDFIEKVESKFSPKDRDGDGVVYDLRIRRDYTDSVYREYPITVTKKSEDGTVSQETTHWETVERSENILRIQLKTEVNEDKIVYFVGDGVKTIELKDLQSLKDALSK